MPDYQSPSGPRCALHEGQPASSICDRCGNFMCDPCTEGRTVATCPSCRVLTGGGFPFSRDSWNFGGLWDYCWRAFKREWVMLSVSVLILFGAAGVINAFSQAFQAGVKDSGVAAVAITTLAFTVLSSVVQGILQMGLFRVSLDVLQGGKADVSRIGSQLSKAGKYLVQVLLTGVVFGVPVLLYFAAVAGVAWAMSGVGQDYEQLRHHPEVLWVVLAGVLLAFVPLFYFLLPLTFAAMELVHDDEVGPWAAVGRAFTIAKGQRLAIFGVALVQGLVVMAGFFACCVGMLPAAGLGQLLMVGLYLALRNGSGLSAPGARST